MNGGVLVIIRLYETSRLIAETYELLVHLIDFWSRFIMLFDFVHIIGTSRYYLRRYFVGLLEFFVFVMMKMFLYVRPCEL